ncbi:MAG: DUF4397 domain-containing protein [Gemmatimonadota bacterium]|nr:DUF4397 domain-containing protein [Gemmatimonadota bacterium]
MRSTRLMLLIPAAFAVAACGGDDSAGPANEQLAFVRYVHAMPDTGGVMVRLVDRVENFVVNNTGPALYRDVGPFNGVVAGSRRIRVFSNPPCPDPPTSACSPAVVTQIIADATLTLNANTYYTLLHTGYARAGQTPQQQLVLIEEQRPAPAANQVAVRTVLAAPGIGPVDVYTPRSTTRASPATPAFTNVAYNPASVGASSNWRTFAPDTMAVRATPAGTTTPVVAEANAPPGAPGQIGLDPSAGVTIGGSAITAFIFPAGVAGSPNNSVTAGSVNYGRDRNPPRP